MRDDAKTQARHAVDRLTPLQREQLLAVLCSSRPEAVLAADLERQRHEDVLRRLLSRGPQLDDV